MGKRIKLSVRTSTTISTDSTEKRPLASGRNSLILLVGATGFEPATPCAQGRCATRLRYAPTDRTDLRSYPGWPITTCSEPTRHAAGAPPVDRRPVGRSRGCRPPDRVLRVGHARL